MNNLMNLYRSTSAMMDEIHHIRDYQDAENGRELTNLEIEMESHLVKLFNLCRQHPDFSEPNPTTHPHWFDLDGDLIPDISEIEKISDEDRKEASREFDDIIKDSLKDFLSTFKIKKSKFAEVYGCTPSYLSRMLSGEKGIDFGVLIKCYHKFGYSLKIKFDTHYWEFIRS